MSRHCRCVIAHVRPHICRPTFIEPSKKSYILLLSSTPDVPKLPKNKRAKSTNTCLFVLLKLFFEIKSTKTGVFVLLTMLIKYVPPLGEG